MSAVELVMEILSSLLEASVNFRVKRKSCLNDWTDLCLDASFKFGKMSGKISSIDHRERGLIRHTDSKKPEVSLESWIDSERTSSWVHSRNELSVFDLFHCKLALVIPMLIVSMLSQ
jgi:hypothetical protein